MLRPYLKIGVGVNFRLCSEGVRELKVHSYYHGNNLPLIDIEIDSSTDKVTFTYIVLLDIIEL